MGAREGELDGDGVLDDDLCCMPFHDWAIGDMAEAMRIVTKAKDTVAAFGCLPSWASAGSHVVGELRSRDRETDVVSLISHQRFASSCHDSRHVGH